MKTTYSIIVLLTFVGAFAISGNAQTTRPTPTPGVAPRPTPTPAARPAATPTPAPANAPVPQTKIAVIDTSMFGDEKTGIYRYIDASRMIANEFKPRTDEVQNLEKRLTALGNEIEALMKTSPANKPAVDAKQQQGEALQVEYNTKKAKLDEDLSKRYDQVVAPISRQIGSALDQFASQRGVTMTLDLSKLLPVVLTMMPAVDLTQAFINDFNSKNPRVGAPPTTPRP
jgi:Skp family chaperone for outer membrane proteins